MNDKAPQTASVEYVDASVKEWAGQLIKVVREPLDELRARIEELENAADPNRAVKASLTHRVAARKAAIQTFALDYVARRAEVIDQGSGPLDPVLRKALGE